MRFIFTKLQALSLFISALIPHHFPIAQDLPSTVPMSKFWSTDYNVSSSALSPDGNTLYLGGSFRYLRSDNSGAFAFNASSGATQLSMPMVQGDVYAAISDGNGGWYIGGNFTMVGDSPRNGLAHITSGNVVRQAFAPNISVGTVQSLALHGTTLYAGGDFSSVNGEERLRLAAFDINTGALLAWNPSVTGSSNPAPTVYSMTIDAASASLYVGGRFTGVGNSARRAIARFNLSTGALSSWAPTLGPSYEPGTVYALAFDPNQNTIFAGGYFRAVNDVQTSFHLVGLHASDGIKLPWTANVSGIVRALALDTQNQALYLGGTIASVGGQPRNALAAINPNNGVVSDWNPIIQNSGALIQSLQLDSQSNILYLGGRFSAVNGTARRRLAAVSTLTGAPTSLEIPIGEDQTGSLRTVATISLSPDRSNIFAGGENLILEHRRNRLAAIDVGSGQVTNWNPDLRGMLIDDPNHPDLARVDKLGLHTASGKLLVAATAVRYFGGQDLGFRRLFAIDSATGVPDVWNPDISSPYGVSSSIAALLVDQQNDFVYVGGTFATADGEARRNLVRYRLSDHTLDSWNPQVGQVPTMFHSDSVSALELDNATNTLYVGGLFTQVGSVSRTRLAAINTITAEPLLWQPRLVHISDSPTAGLYNARVFSLFLDRARQSIFVGFNGLLYVESLPRHGLAEISTANDRFVYPGNPLSGFYTPTIYSMARDQESGLLYVGGMFYSASGDMADRRSILAVDLSTRLLSPWQPIGTGDSTGTYGNLLVNTLHIDATRGVLYSAGTFGSMGGLPKSNFAAFQLRDPEQSCPADFDGNGQLGTPDLFAFLNAWFARDMRADFDRSSSVAVPDLFAFLTAWFEGC